MICARESLSKRVKKRRIHREFSDFSKVLDGRKSIARKSLGYACVGFMTVCFMTVS